LGTSGIFREVSSRLIGVYVSVEQLADVTESGTPRNLDSSGVLSRPIFCQWNEKATFLRAALDGSVFNGGAISEMAMAVSCPAVLLLLLDGGSTGI
jgi:hypothetical protein